MEGHGNFIRSRAAADRAFELLLLYMKEHMELKSPKIGQFTLAHQEDFMRWCSRRKLSAKSIATYLSMIKAGVEYCARPRVTADHRGKQIESRTITTAPFIQTSQREVCRVTGLAKPVPREFIPSDAELAAFLDAIFAGSADRSQREHIFRYCIIALNTWARPEAICELDMKEQVKLTDGLVDLNTKGRAQNNKYRPTIRLTDNLRGWLLHWNEDRPIRHLGQPVKEISPKTFKRIALRAGLPEMVRYTLRHYCNTRAMNVPADIRPDREERAIWMGHHDPRHSTTMVYEHRSPDYLMRCAKATDAFMTALDNLTEISLFAPNTTKQGLYVIEKRA
jgi:integrase